MKTYKNRKADLEPKRAGFFVIGLVLACGLTLCAFEWRAPGEYISIAEYQGTTIEMPDPPPPIIKYVSEPMESAQKKQGGQPHASEITIEFKVDHSNTADDDDLSDLGDDDEIEEGDTGEPEVKYVPVFTRVEQMPSFPGGEEARAKFLGRHLTVPYGFRSSSASLVTVDFVVWSDGSIRSVSINEDADERLAKEVLRVMALMPNWNPGIQGKVKVPVRLSMPVRFNTNG